MYFSISSKPKGHKGSKHFKGKMGEKVITINFFVKTKGHKEKLEMF